MRWQGASASLLGLLLRAQEAASAGRIDGKLNVHLVCHTHDDAGWLKTVDQYFYGSNRTITPAGVQYILDSVVSALEEDEKRKFVYAEQAFMWRWWRQQNSDKKKTVRRLVSDGRLSFVNGGWVMHDEAAAHYVGMVDQTHLGHTFLRQEFGEDALPRVAWQIDPFGHSATQASLLGAQAGFDALYFGRIDYQDAEKRIDESEMEMLWRSSRSFEEEAQIFTGVFHSGNYGPPVGFCFDQYCQDEPMMDDPLMADYNVERRASEFADACQALGRNTIGEDIMLQMGGDFGFGDANAWFKNIDILLEAVNKEGRVNAFYSTPQQYTVAKHASGVHLSVKKDDFFPYADCPYCYWTGYFSSRPGLKRLERVTSGYLQAARQLQALAGEAVRGKRGPRETASELESLAALERAQGLAQHHDAITGTSRQHVADDYAQRLDRARVSAEAVVSAALARLAFGEEEEEEGGGERGAPPPRLRQCRLANVSTCDVTMEAVSGFLAVTYNPMAQARSGYVDVPISWSDVVVTDAVGKPVIAQVLPFHHKVVGPSSAARDDVDGKIDGGGGADLSPHPYTLMLPVESAEPLEAKVFNISRKKEGEATESLDDAAGTGGKETGQGGPRRRHYVGGEKTVDSFSISSDLVTLTFDGGTGRLSRMETHAKEEGGGEDGGAGARRTIAALDLDQGWYYYPTFAGGGGEGEAGKKASKESENDAAGQHSTGEEEAKEEDRRQNQRQPRVPSRMDGAVEASRLHGQLRERLHASQDQKGGAYIFRPDGEGRGGAIPVRDAAGGEDVQEDLVIREWWVEEGPIVSEVYQMFSNWVVQTVRVRHGQPYAELDWRVGPIPVGSNSNSPLSDSGDAGKELISRFSAPSIASKGTFHTDANGREFQKRVRDYRPTWDLNVTQPVSGNYYPVTAAAFLRDEGGGDSETDGGMQLSVLTDRAQGCASLADGELELMAHRRILTEDQRGVGEALNETTDGMTHYPDWERRGDGLVFRGTHYLVVSKKRDGMKAVRSAMDEVFNPFIVGFGKQETPRAPATAGERPPARAEANAAEVEAYAAAAEAATKTPGTLRQEEKEETEEPAPPPDGGSLEAGGLVKALPANVGLMTLMHFAEGEGRRNEPWEALSHASRPTSERGGRLTLLVRLAHRYAKGEDELLSQPATVDLSQLIVGYTLRDAEEVALTGGASRAARGQRLKWTATPTDTPPAADAEDDDGVDDRGSEGELPPEDGDGHKDWNVTLGPMEIKTYRLELNPHR
eukprot:g6415.t1